VIAAQPLVVKNYQQSSCFPNGSDGAKRYGRIQVRRCLGVRLRDALDSQNDARDAAPVRPLSPAGRGGGGSGSDPLLGGVSGASDGYDTFGRS
jgi:hypothetical protein